LLVRLGLVIDLERCIGCGTCTVACKVENSPTTASSWIWVETLGGQKDTPTGQYPDLKMEFIPHLCMHCANPACLEVCHTSALWKREDGLVLLDKEKCDGCQACVAVCPYQAIVYSSKTELVEKCDLCAHRIEQSLEPFCVVCCEGQAMHFGDLNNPASEVSRLVADRDTFTLMHEAGTSPSIFYCPPRERRRL